MSTLSARVQRLSPERRALLARALREDGGAASPLSFSQQRLWFLHRWDPDSPAYNLPFAARLSGLLDAGALAWSLDQIARRHEILRTTFFEIDGEPFQAVDDDVTPFFSLEDLSGLEPRERRLGIEALLADAGARPFDLASGPLLRAGLFRCAPEDHLLVLVFHHIVFDGWSIGIFLEELAALYAARCGGRSPELPILPIQYADFARWERAAAGGEASARQMAYWRKKLAGAPGVLELPADRPRSPERTGRGGTETLVVPASTAAALRELGSRHGVTLFMTLLAALKVLLLRYTGQEDVVVGTPIAHRNRGEVERLIGFFVNTLVLRTDLSGDPTFGELLGRVRRTSLDAYTNQDVPFEALVEELQPDRDPSHTPLFQTMFVLQNAPLNPVELAGLTLSPMPVPAGTAKFDLTLSVEESDGELGCALVYDGALFDASTAARILAHYRSLLEGVAAGADRPISELPMQPADDRRRLLQEWAGTSSSYPRDASLTALFEDQAARSPGSVALAGETTLTYRDLDRRAGRVARRLAGLGVGPEQRVGLCSERSPDMIAGLIGILKCGAAYVPLDPDDPPERLAFTRRDAALRAILAPRELRSLVSSWSGSLPILDLEEPGGEEDQSVRLRHVQADRLACILYTSGSTGRPKGVAVTHRSVVRLVRGNDYIHFGPEQVFLQHSSIAFDASLLEIWGALLHGGRLAILPPGRPSLQELGRAIERHGVTTLWLTAPLFHQMVDDALESLHGVRQLLAGGDVLSPAHVERALRSLPSCRIVNGYGPTEATTFACCCDLRWAGAGRSSVPIGRPIRNTRVYVLDARREPVPIGVPGDLYIAGDGLARGYADTTATAERFVPDPHAGSPGERMYDTGDRARWLEDGTLEFLGRRDRQVKVRGYRVEPGEVESALASHPAVREAAVVTTVEGGDRRLMAYVVMKEGGAGQEAGLRLHLKQRLPGYMVPALWVWIDALPRTSSGKVDRERLPPARGEIAREAAAEPPRTPVECALAGIWEEVLGVQRVGLRDDFFALGGHSLRATQVVSRARQVWGVELPLRRLFECPKLGELAASVEGLLRETSRREAAPRATPGP